MLRLNRDSSSPSQSSETNVIRSKPLDVGLILPISLEEPIVSIGGRKVRNGLEIRITFGRIDDYMLMMCR